MKFANIVPEFYEDVSSAVDVLHAEVGEEVSQYERGGNDEEVEIFHILLYENSLLSPGVKVAEA